VTRRATALALAAVLALGAGATLAACGGEEEGEPIPARQARSLQRQLANIERQSNNAACAGAEDKVEALERSIDRLPDDVDADVREALADGVARLRGLVEEECERRREERRREREEQQETETTPETSEPETETSDTTDTEPTDTTDTGPPDTTDTEPTEPTDPGFTTPGGNVPPGQDGGTPAPEDE
jgi:TolA-binding protein